MENVVCSKRGIDLLIIRKGNQISNDDDIFLIRLLEGITIKQALFDIDSDKAPMIDGFNSSFFKNAWEIVEEDAIEVM